LIDKYFAEVRSCIVRDFLRIDDGQRRRGVEAVPFDQGAGYNDFLDDL
jgi:hypothetical protein